MTKKELVQDIRTAKGLLEVNEIADAHLFLDKLKRRILEEGVSSEVQPRVSQGGEDEEEAGVLLPKLNKRLAIYQKAINRIDDYFEYRYAQFDREEIKKHVYDVLDNLAKKLEATKSKEIGKRNTR